MNVLKHLWGRLNQCSLLAYLGYFSWMCYDLWTRKWRCPKIYLYFGGTNRYVVIIDLKIRKAVSHWLVNVFHFLGAAFNWVGIWVGCWEEKNPWEADLKSVRMTCWLLVFPAVLNVCCAGVGVGKTRTVWPWSLKLGRVECLGKKVDHQYIDWR